MGGATRERNTTTPDVNLLISWRRAALFTECLFWSKVGFSNSATSSERQSQVGSLAGAAHLLNDNAGVLR